MIIRRQLPGDGARRPPWLDCLETGPPASRTRVRTLENLEAEPETARRPDRPSLPYLWSQRSKEVFFSVGMTGLLRGTLRRSVPFRNLKIVPASGHWNSRPVPACAVGCPPLYLQRLHSPGNPEIRSSCSGSTEVMLGSGPGDSGNALQLLQRGAGARANIEPVRMHAFDANLARRRSSINEACCCSLRLYFRPPSLQLIASTPNKLYLSHFWPTTELN
jgi:hypothetical protein